MPGYKLLQNNYSITASQYHKVSQIVHNKKKNYTILVK